MPRMSDVEKLAALEKRKTEIQARQLKIDRAMRSIQSRQKNQARADDARRKIIAGALALEHADKHPGSDFARTLHRLLDDYTRPEDRRFFDFLPAREPPPSPAPDASAAA